MGKVISLAERRAEREFRKQNEPIPGYLVWLHCPTCQTTEYTELRAKGGRLHNKCGTLVEEQEVAIDIRAEYTIVSRNLHLLEEWKNKTDLPKLFNKLLRSAKQVLPQIEAVEKEYQKRLNLMWSTPIPLYPEDWDPNEHGMVYKIIRPFGILLTAARQPDLYFPLES